MTTLHRDDGMRAGHDRKLLGIVRDHYPDLSVYSANVASGQFNDALIVNDELVFRFPRTNDAAAMLAIEVGVLRGLQGRVPVAVPNPAFTAIDAGSSQPRFMGYWLLPGKPLDRVTLDELWIVDRPAFARLGQQTGAFLRALHGTPAEELALVLPVADDAAFWSRMLAAFRDELFGFMRLDACTVVEQTFAEYLGDRDNFAWRAALRHGDFGGANLLFDTETKLLSGVIDFGGVALGDPAVDLAATLAFHGRLAHAMRPAYPGLFAPGPLRRATFYRSTFSLQQALWALRAGDEEEFDDGIAAYI